MPPPGQLAQLPHIEFYERLVFGQATKSNSTSRAFLFSLMVLGRVGGIFMQLLHHHFGNAARIVDLGKFADRCSLVQVSRFCPFGINSLIVSPSLLACQAKNSFPPSN